VPSQVSELRVALVAEGPTDRVVIEAALKAILARPFTLALLQPESTRPLLGGGWCGVFKWCREFAARSHLSLESDPTLPGFDLFVIHLDADVADMRYADGGAPVEEAAQGMPPLPCSHPCPPPARTVDELRQRLLAWLGIARLGPKTALCVPSKAVDAWLAAGVLDPPHPLLEDIECSFKVESNLASLPKAQRIHKTRREYQARASTITDSWTAITARCSQAARFGAEVMALVPAVDISGPSEAST